MAGNGSKQKPKRTPLPGQMSDAIYTMKVITGEIEGDPNAKRVPITRQEFLDRFKHQPDTPTDEYEAQRQHLKLRDSDEPEQEKKSRIAIGSGRPMPECDCDMKIEDK